VASRYCDRVIPGRSLASSRCVSLLRDVGLPAFVWLRLHVWRAVHRPSWGLPSPVRRYGSAHRTNSLETIEYFPAKFRDPNGVRQRALQCIVEIRLLQ
jgi:hypothetical protein